MFQDECPPKTVNLPSITAMTCPERGKFMSGIETDTSKLGENLSTLLYTSFLKERTLYTFQHFKTSEVVKKDLL